jgi:predicted nucleic acid-binding Zn ribbon protein
MPKEPLYPHVPKSRQPQFPHVKGRQLAETTGPLPVVTVICPICGKEIEVPEYNAVTRSDALREHLKKEHPYHPMLLQVTVEGGEPVSPQYRDLVGLVSEPIPGYSLLTEPAVVEQKERKVDAVMKQLKAGVEGIQESHQFRLFLTTMSKFHDYSIGNQILIMIQKPAATHVAGFNTWKDLGRWVKKSEQGIAILAPVLPPRPTCPQCGAKLPKGARFCPECSAPVEEVESEATPRFFKVVYVFDLAQTEGKPLPEFEVPVLTGDVNEELFTKLLDLMKAKSVPVSFESRPHQDPGIKGQYSPASGIWVRPEEPRAQQLKSLAHEIAHHYSEGVFRIPRQDAETIAESAAFVVGAHYGFDTGVRSFPYVALWARDKKVLEKNLGDIRKVATTIIDQLA